MFVDHLRPTPLTTIQIVVGLWLFGVGLAFIVRGANGQGAWTVFHDGLSQHTPFSIGGATVLTGLVILVVVLAMRVRIGLGTLLNIAIIGPATDTTLWLLDDIHTGTQRSQRQLGYETARLGLGGRGAVGARGREHARLQRAEGDAKAPRRVLQPANDGAVDAHDVARVVERGDGEGLAVGRPGRR